MLDYFKKNTLSDGVGLIYINFRKPQVLNDNIAIKNINSI